MSQLFHLLEVTQYAGLSSPYRKIIAPNPKVKKDFQFEDEQAAGPDDSLPRKRKFKNYTWPKMLAKIFKIDVTVCTHCRGPLQKITAV